MKAKKVILNGTSVGYQVWTGTGLGIVDIDRESCSRFGIELDVFGRLDLDDKMYKDSVVRDISDMHDICFTLGILTNESRRLNLFSEVCTGQKLQDRVSEFSEFSSRGCLEELISSSLGIGDTSKRLTILYGVRRTGKTVLMMQAISELLKRGIPRTKILYCSVADNADSDLVYCFLTQIASSFDIDYIFVDEFTSIMYDTSDTAEGDKNAEGYLGYFSEGSKCKHFILSGTNSAFFISPETNVWYDRVNKISTSYISFKEFKKLYPDASIDEYITCGGLLFNAKDMNFGLSEHIEKYINTAIIDNLFNAFKTTKLGYLDNFSVLKEMYARDKNRARSFIYKCVQRYSCMINQELLDSRLVVSDIGITVSAFGFNKKKANYDITIFKKRISKRFLELFEFNDSQFSLDEIDAVKSFLREIHCLIESDVNKMNFIIPLGIRYGCTMAAADLLISEFDSLSSDLNLPFTKDEFRTKMLSVVHGILFESVIYSDLSIRGVSFSKIRIGATKEVDLMIGSDLYEIKFTENKSLLQLRWLFDKEIWEKTSPSSINVIYKGVSRTESQTRREVLDFYVDFMRNKYKDSCLSKSDIIPDYYEQINSADADAIVEVHYINVDDFLMR